MSTTVTVDPSIEQVGARAPSTFQAQPPIRQRVADHVFESLARAILTGELKPGEPVPTQRDLARQFNVSALVVRQAIHRLEDLSLVRVRQGSTTVVLDPNESSDIRLIQLQMEIAEPGPVLALAAFENQALFVIPLLALAERRITDQELAVLNYLIESLGDEVTPDAARRFRLEFWRQIAKATRNSLFAQQVRWWSTLAKQLDQRGSNARAPWVKFEIGLYRRLVVALAAHQGAVALYLEAMKPLLDWVDGKRGFAKAEK